MKFNDKTYIWNPHGDHIAWKWDRLVQHTTIDVERATLDVNRGRKTEHVPLRDFIREGNPLITPDISKEDALLAQHDIQCQFEHFQLDWRLKDSVHFMNGKMIKIVAHSKKDLVGLQAPISGIGAKIRGEVSFYQVDLGNQHPQRYHYLTPKQIELVNTDQYIKRYHCPLCCENYDHERVPLVHVPETMELSTGTVHLHNAGIRVICTMCNDLRQDIDHPKELFENRIFDFMEKHRIWKLNA